MADHFFTRRHLLKLSAVAGGLATAGFATWRMSAPLLAETGGELPAAAAGGYRPAALTGAQFELLDVLTEAIIPEDDTPGARAAGVAEFVDFYCSRREDLALQLREACDWYEAAAAQRHGRALVALNDAERLAILRSSALAGRSEGGRHFAFLKEYTVFGFYSSETGWRELDNPALRSSYTFEELPGHRDGAAPRTAA